MEKSVPIVRLLVLLVNLLLVCTGFVCRAHGNSFKIEDYLPTFALPVLEADATLFSCKRTESAAKLPLTLARYRFHALTLQAIWTPTFWDSSLEVDIPPPASRPAAQSGPTLWTIL